MDVKNLSKNKVLRQILIGLGILIIALLIFHAGVLVGYRKAIFAEHLGGNFNQAFDFHHPMMMGLPGDDLPGGHGAVGKIVSVASSTLIVAGADNVEKIVVIDNSTLIRAGRSTASSSDLKVDQFVIVLGEPNSSGQIMAKLIRIMSR